MIAPSNTNKLLIVDDEKTISELLARILELEEYVVTSAATAEETIKKK